MAQRPGSLDSSEGFPENALSPEIERREGLSYRDFVKDYLEPHRPVILTDALRDWRALSLWTPEFFKTRYGDMRIEIGKRSYTMGDFIDRVLASTVENPAPYFEGQRFCDLLPVLLEDIFPVPPYLFPNWLDERYFPPQLEGQMHRGNELEIFIGGNGSGFFKLHYDYLRTHTFIMHVYGRKKFIVYSPDQSPWMYAPRKERDRSPVGDVERPDIEKYPLFARAVPTIFVLEPGETLFVPPGWWHTSRMLTPCISVAVNTANASNWADVTKELVYETRQERPWLAVPLGGWMRVLGGAKRLRDRIRGQR